ncbi:hypothetical protein [Dongshaea marina]|uniref:hypothetical protein n=1 Tax=Dongshaea marina TaxID=2047966 RepID=UPI00131EFF4D|nr:hypothetical protein [Dongshaea marina]
MKKINVAQLAREANKTIRAAQDAPVEIQRKGETVAYLVRFLVHRDHPIRSIAITE